MQWARTSWRSTSSSEEPRPGLQFSQPSIPSAISLVCLVTVNILLRDHKAQQVGPQDLLLSLDANEHTKGKSICISFILLINHYQEKFPWPFSSWRWIEDLPSTLWVSSLRCFWKALCLSTIINQTSFCHFFPHSWKGLDNKKVKWNERLSGFSEKKMLISEEF